jgi:hypothetical protein
MIIEMKQLFINRSDYDHSDHHTILKKLKKENIAIPTITVNQTCFKTVRNSFIDADKQTVFIEKKTSFLIWSLKRIPVWEANENIINTIPFGYNKLLNS